jgi:deferrochelatase/peroxidase EfeB
MLDAGLLFLAYQRDPGMGFIPINRKLASADIMNQYTTHLGSAIFACPAGISKGSYIGSDLFAGLGPER